MNRYHAGHPGIPLYRSTREVCLLSFVIPDNMVTCYWTLASELSKDCWFSLSCRVGLFPSRGLLDFKSICCMTRYCVPLLLQRSACDRQSRSVGDGILKKLKLLKLVGVVPFFDLWKTDHFVQDMLVFNWFRKFRELVRIYLPVFFYFAYFCTVSCPIKQKW